MKAPSDMTDRELDVAVAVEVMGWKRGEPWGNGNGPWIINGKVDDFVSWNTTPRYSTDIAAAWEVLAKFPSVEQRIECVLIWRDDERQAGWYCRIGEHHNAPAYAATAPRAICLAALAAVRGRK